MEKELELKNGEPAVELSPLLEALAGSSPAQVCAQLAGVLAGPYPASLTLLLLEGRLARYGLPGHALKRAARPERVLLPLEAVPAVPLLRWWGLLRLTEAFVPRVASAFGWDKLMVQRLGQLDNWYCGGMPEDRNALKHRLQQPLPVGTEDALATFAALSPEYVALPAEYAALLDSGEPFREEELCITDAELRAVGVPRRRLAAMRQCLLEAVLDTPALNTRPMLTQMAESLRGLV